jgi:hypothetical protein
LGAPPRRGARRALSDLGLGSEDAALTVHDVRSLSECVQFVRRTAVEDSRARHHHRRTEPLIALLAGIR